MKHLSFLIGFLFVSTLFAQSQDMRQAFSQQTQQYIAQHFPNGSMPPKHVWTQSPPGLVRQNIAPTPGGIGYGFTYDTGALLWTNRTIADYYVIAPTYLTQPVSYLYLTSTCRAQLGTESLIAYQGTSEAGFWIYDWSKPSGSQWQLMIDLPTSNPQYLTNRLDEFAVSRQMVHVRNGTYLLGYNGQQYSWANQTLLFNFKRGGWDLAYSSTYTTSNLTDNTYVPGGSGWWGPIVETFDSYTNVNPLGFDLIRLFQDGNPNPCWLTQNNSYSTISTPWQVMTLAPNTSFTVAVSSSNLVQNTNQFGALCVTGNTTATSYTISATGGRASPFWIITPNSNSWDNTVVGLSSGSYSINFKTSVGQPVAAKQSFTINPLSVTTIQPAPVLTSPQLSSNGVKFTFSAFSNAAYQVQYTSNFSSPAWMNLGAPITATNLLMKTVDTTPRGSSRFYQVVLLQ